MSDEEQVTPAGAQMQKRTQAEWYAEVQYFQNKEYEQRMDNKALKKEIAQLSKELELLNEECGGLNADNVRLREALEEIANPTAPCRHSVESMKRRATEALQGTGDSLTGKTVDCGSANSGFETPSPEYKGE